MKREIDVSSGFGASYAACDVHAIDAIRHFPTGTFVRVTLINTPHDNVKCHCLVPATFQLLERR